MKNKKLLLLAALAIAATAYAANVTIQRTPWFFASQVTINDGRDFANTSNRITRALAGQVDYDFPAIAPGYTILSPDFIIDGGRLGDPCSIGVMQSVADGGWDPQVRIACLVSSDNRVMILASSAGGDGGSPNPRDAGYLIRVISAQ